VINKVHLTETADNKSKTYNGSPFSPFTVTLSGFVNGENSSVVTGSPGFTGSAVGAFNAGTYTITPTAGILSAINYDFTTFNNGTLTVTEEDARPYYTGPTFVNTSGPTSTMAIVTLSATIKDITPVDPSASDPHPDNYQGVITNAKVTFINRDNNTVIASNVPVGLVNAGDSTVGTATYNWTVNISPNVSQQYTIGIIVTNYYTRNSSFDDDVVTVSVPPAAGSIT